MIVMKIVTIREKTNMLSLGLASIKGISVDKSIFFIVYYLLFKSKRVFKPGGVIF
jgi:hypothetical protein